MQRRAQARDEHVAAEEARRAAELQALAGGQVPALAELLAEARVGRQRAGRAVEVELGVRARRAAVLDRDLDQLLAPLVERLGERHQELAALAEGERAQRRPADLVRVRQHRPEVDPRARGLGDALFVGRVLDRRRGAAAGLPAAGDEALQGLHGGFPSALRALAAAPRGPSRLRKKGANTLAWAPRGASAAPGAFPAGLSKKDAGACGRGATILAGARRPAPALAGRCGRELRAPPSNMKSGIRGQKGTP